MPSIKQALYSAWDDATTKVDETRILSDTMAWNENIDAKVLINYLLNAVNKTAYYEGVGTFEGQPINLSKCGEIQSAVLTWAENKPASTTIIVEIALSTDSGLTWGQWQQVANGGNIPGLAAGMNLLGYRIKYRVKFTTTNLTVAPSISQIKLTVSSRKLFRIFSTGAVKVKADIIPTAVEQL